MSDEDEVARNRDAQARLYGLPLQDLLRRYGSVLGLTQARLADLLGVSAPMLSQLANGRRVRFGNPASVQRLQVLHTVVSEVEAGRIDGREGIRRVEANRSADVFTVTSPTEDSAWEAVRGVLAATAPPEEHRAAARLLEAAHPAIALLLLAAGAGDEGAARALRGGTDAPPVSR